MLLITLDSCRYDTLPQYHPGDGSSGTSAPCDGTEPFHLRPHAAIFKGFLPSVRGEKPLLNSKLAKLFRLVNAGWPGKEREFLVARPFDHRGLPQVGISHLGSGAVGWFDPATETGRCLTAEFERFFYPGSTWQMAEQLAWVNDQYQDMSHEQPLLLF